MDRALCEVASAVAFDEVAAAAADGAAHLTSRTRCPWWRVLWRAFVLFFHAAPVVCALPFCLLLWRRGGERFFWWLALAALQAHGPIAVKFAQWASTRPDILPPEVCGHFAQLQDAVTPHAYRRTAQALEEAFGPGWATTLQVEPESVGSGCMAQVHRGRLVQPGQPEREIAVKVLHPGAREKVDLDLDVLWKVVGLLETLFPSAQYLAMAEALGHFEAFVRPQADMRIEAANLEAFCRNFPYARTGRGLAVRFPEVVRPYVRASVLVETYEAAAPLQAVLGQTPAWRAQSGGGGPNMALPGVPDGMTVDEVRDRVGKLCMEMFLQMMFADNFIHGDLHPGNIRFRFPEGARGKPELVIFDAGLAVKLSPRDRRNFVELFHAISMNDGPRAGRLMVERSPGDRGRVIDEEGFVKGVAELTANVRSGGIALGKVRLGDAFSKIIGMACDHRVKLETSFVTIAMSIIVIEGVGRQLNPLVDIVWAARPWLVEALKQRFW